MLRSRIPLLMGAFGIVAAASFSGFDGSALAQDWASISRSATPAMVYIVATRRKNDGTDPRELTSSGFLVSFVGASGCEGTAIANGITVAHAFPEANADEQVEYKAIVGTNDGFRKRLTLIKRDDELDIALFRLEVSVQSVRSLQVNTSPSVGPGSELGALGFSLGGSLRFLDGRLSSTRGPKGWWDTTLALNRGDSGGPVFDDRGKVIGIAVGGLPNANAVNYVIPANLLPLALPNVPLQGQSPCQSSPVRYRVHGVAHDDVLNVRAGPSASDAKVTELPPGAGNLTKLACENGWCRIARDGQELGYVSSKYLIEEGPGGQSASRDSSCGNLDEVSQGIFRVAGVALNDTLMMRREPHVRSGNVVGKIPYNADDVQVGVCSIGWCLVRYNGQCGYASSQFLRHSDSNKAPSE